MRRTTSPRPPGARLTPRDRGRRLLLAAVVGAVGSAFAVLPVVAQDGPVRQNRPVGEPPPARVDPQGPVGAAADATRPATRPAGESPLADLSPADLRTQLGKSFADLAHPAPAVREAARVRLMGMTRANLPAFEAVVRDSLPLAAAQATALREVVTQAYLAGEPYPCNQTEGFLGVRLADVNVGARPAEDAGGKPAPAPEAAGVPVPGLPPVPVLPPGLVPPPGLVVRPVPVLPPGPFDPAVSDGLPTTGVAILERMPGFCGARMFQDGDVVLEIASGPQQVPIRSTYDMRATVVKFGAGETVQFEVLRQGQVVRVPIVLDPRPSDVDPLVGVQTLIDARRNSAEMYWAQTFGAMLKERAG